MIILGKTRKRRKQDNTIALINIVFLMLVFFLIAGTVVPPLDKAISPVQSLQSDETGLEDVLSIRQDGTLSSRGDPISLEAFLSQVNSSLGEEVKTVRILPDKQVKGTQLLDLIEQVKQAGISKILIVTERQSP